MRLSATDVHAFQALGPLATQPPGCRVSSEWISLQDAMRAVDGGAT